jgi:histone H3/H4
MGEHDDAIAGPAAFHNNSTGDDYSALVEQQRDSSDLIYPAGEVKRIEYDIEVESPPPPPQPSGPPKSTMPATEEAALEIDNVMLAPQSPDDSESHKDRDTQDMHAPGLGYDFEVKEQDRWLPIANVARIMKTALPENAKISKEAKECMQECVSEFIAFVTSEAAEKCQQEKRKTVNGEDLLFAMSSLGLEQYAEVLKIYLARYREHLQMLESQKQTAGEPEQSRGAERGSV